jgi:hypothetical protein
MINNKLWTLDKQNIQYSYDLLFFAVLPKKDKIDPWCLAMLDHACLTFSLSNNLLVLDSSVDRRTDRIKRNLGNKSVGD